MKMARKTSVDGEWAKVDVDISNGDLVTIKDAGDVVSGEYGDRYVFKIETKNGEKNLSFNQTTVNHMVEAYGDDSEAYVGKEVKVFVIQQMIDNTLRNVVYLTPPDWTIVDGKFKAPAVPASTESVTGEKKPDYPTPEGENIKPENIPF